MAFPPLKTAVLANDAYVTLIYLYRWVRRLLRTLLIFGVRHVIFSFIIFCSFSISLKGVVLCIILYFQLL